MPIKLIACVENEGVLEKTGFQPFTGLNTTILKKDEEITSTPFDSIPSPLARMETVVEAFKYVNGKYSNAETPAEKKEVLNGKTYYHRIISECLDTGMLFYCGEELFKGKCEINIKKETEEEDNNEIFDVKDSSDSYLKLGRALELFWEYGENYAGLATVNWDGEIIGAISPVSLFIARADVTNFLIGKYRTYKLYEKSIEKMKEELNAVQDEHQQKKTIEKIYAEVGKEIMKKEFPSLLVVDDRPFKPGEKYILYSGKPRSLIERPFGFIKYVYINSGRFRRLEPMKYFLKYVDNCYESFDAGLKRRLGGQNE